MKIQTANYQINYNNFKSNDNINKNNAETPHFGTASGAGKRVASEAKKLGVSTFVKTWTNKFLGLFKSKEIVMESRPQIIVRGAKIPLKLTNLSGDIVVEPGVKIEGVCQAMGGIDFKGILSEGGELVAEKNIVASSPELFGQIISEHGNVTINAKKFEGLTIVGEDVSVSSSSPLPNQAHITARGNIDIHCSLHDAIIFKGKTVTQHKGVLNKVSVDCENFSGNGCIGVGTEIRSKGKITLGEDAAIHPTATLVAPSINDIIDNRTSKEAFKFSPLGFRPRFNWPD